MPYLSLYNRRQENNANVLPLEWYVNDACDLQWVDGIKLVRSPNMPSRDCRGFIIRNPSHLFNGMTDNYFVTTSAENDCKTDKIVCMKELIHCYDDSVANVDTGAKFEELVIHFYGRTQENIWNLAIEAEYKAFWMALAVVTTEDYRKTMKTALLADASLVTQFSDELHVPDYIILALISDRYDDEVAQLLGSY